MIDTLPPLREVIRAHGLDARKALGQNFLLDFNITMKIARAVGPLEGVTVLEIGPGPGGLTRALLASGARHVIAIERDPRCMAALAEIEAANPGRLTVIEGDALKMDYTALLQNRGPLRICANLPYNVGTELLIGWLRMEWPPLWERMVLMFQREVAERIIGTPAKPSDYGRLGVLCGWRSEAKILFDLPPSAFMPPPKVTSSVVELRPRASLGDTPLLTLERVTMLAFSQRRKMLRQSLKSLPDLAGLFARSGLDGTERPETLPVSVFLSLASDIGRIQDNSDDKSA